MFTEIVPCLIITYYLTRTPKRRRKRGVNSKRKNNLRGSGLSGASGNKLDIRDNGTHIEKSGSAEDDEYS